MRMVAGYDLDGRQRIYNTGKVGKDRHVLTRPLLGRGRSMASGYRRWKSKALCNRAFNNKCQLADTRLCKWQMRWDEWLWTAEL